MKNLQTWRFLAPGLAASFLLVSGCQDKDKDGVPDAPATSQQIERTVDDAGKTVEKGVEKAVPALEKGVATAVPAIEKSVEKGASMAADATITGKVKSALLANKNITAANIDVDTKNKIVYLSGSVTTNGQRALASQIARKAAGAGHPIKNNLKVIGKSANR